MDAKLETGKWQIKPLLALVPEKFTKSLKDLNVDGTIQLDATAKAIMPIRRCRYSSASDAQGRRRCVQTAALYLA